MKKKYLIYLCLFILTGCKWELPDEKMPKVCVLPTDISATTDPADARKFTFSLPANVTADVTLIIWKAQFGTTVLNQAQLKATEQFNVTMPGVGDYTITAEVQTVCNDKIPLSKPVSVQGVFKIWDKTIGGINSEYFTTIVPTSDGGFLLGGNSDSGISGEKSENSRGDFDYWIIKINANGIKQWDKTYGGTGADVLSAIVPTTDGGFLLGGSSDSNVSGEKSESSRGSNDYWIVKINAMGVKQWDKTFGGIINDKLIALVGSIDGSFLLGGASDSNISGEKSESSRGLNDYWVVKINAAGIKQWDKTFGGSASDELKAMVATSDGGFLLGGSAVSGASFDKTEISRGSSDIWIVKINTNGVKQWDKTFGGVLNEFLNTIITTSDGGFVFGGLSSSNISNEKTENSRGDADYWIIKINASGIKQWDKAYGGAAYDEMNSIVVTSDGGFLLGGVSESNISNEKTENNRGLGDYWVVKITANGVKQWDKIWGGTGQERLRMVVATSDGGYLFGGEASSNASFEKSENSRGANDYWIISVK